MALTAPPPVPSRATDTAAAFSSKADALLAWLPTNVSELSALQTDVSSKQATASTAATTASTAATAAQNSQTAAAASQTAAQNSQTSAANLLASMQALYNTFSDQYLGAHATDPTVDSHGNPLTDGDFYINSVTGFLRAYTAAGGWVQGIASVAGVSAINGQAGALTLKTVNGGSLLGAGDLVVGAIYVNASGNVSAQDNLVDTRAGAITLTLPAAPAANVACRFTDIANAFGTNACTLGRNGKSFLDGNGNIHASDFVLDIAGASVTVFFDGTYWRIS